MAPQKTTTSSNEAEQIEKAVLLYPPTTKPDDNTVFEHTDFEKNYFYFHRMQHDEPHTIRRKQMLQK